MFFSIIKISLFALSTLGTWELLYRNTSVNIHFIPSLVIAIQTSLLFIAGILNTLSEVSMMLYCAGFLALIYYLYKDKSAAFLKHYFTPGYFFFIAVLVFELFFLRGKLFTHYDNFSHWAIVVKNMLEKNRFPNFEDTLILFQDYPLGSSVFIYYFVKCVNNSESLQMLAQVYMMAASILTLFSIDKKHKIGSLLAVIGFTNYCFVYNTTITNLLVDTLLPLVSMSAMLYVFNYCNCISKNKWEFFLASAYMIQIMQIKNSGIFFIAMIVAWLIYRGRYDKCFPERILLALSPFLSGFLWKKHCQYVFAGERVSKHAMTVSNYTKVFEDKTSESIKATCLAVIKYTVLLKDAWVVFMLFFVVGLILYAFHRQIFNIWKNSFIFSLLLYLLYQFGTLGMFVFSMPESEAANLAGIDRYTKSILIAIMFVFIALCIKIINTISVTMINDFAIGLAINLFLFGYIICSMGSFRTVFKYYDNDSSRRWMESLSHDYPIPDGASCCILLIPKESAGYLSYMGKYTFQSMHITARQVENISDMANIKEDYILIHDISNNIINKWVQENYPEQQSEKVIVMEKTS